MIVVADKIRRWNTKYERLGGYNDGDLRSTYLINLLLIFTWNYVVEKSLQVLLTHLS